MNSIKVNFNFLKDFSILSKVRILLALNLHQTDFMTNNESLVVISILIIRCNSNIQDFLPEELNPINW